METIAQKLAPPRFGSLSVPQGAAVAKVLEREPDLLNRGGIGKTLLAAGQREPLADSFQFVEHGGVLGQLARPR